MFIPHHTDDKLIKHEAFYLCFKEHKDISLDTEFRKAWFIYIISRQKSRPNVMGQGITQKSPATVVEFFLFWGMCLFPSGMLVLFPAPYLVLEEWRKVGGERNGEKLWPIMSMMIKQSSPGTKTIDHCIQHQKRTQAWRRAAWKITGKVYDKLTQPLMATILMRTDTSFGHVWP